MRLFSGWFSVLWHRRRCRRLLLATAVICTMLYLVYWGFFCPSIPRSRDIHRCLVPAEQRKYLFSLMSVVTQLLSQLSVTHFLCYDSLWGAVQESGPLPWTSHGHLCALNQQVSAHDEATLLRTFRRRGLSLEYSSAEGQYMVRNRTTEALPIQDWEAPHVFLVLFEEDERMRMLRRVGWKRRILPPDCDAHSSLECFPPFLAETPLPERAFGPLKLPAPREDIDLLKFHYPDTWWRPLQPHC